MSKLSSCHHCGGFVPAGAEACPHCDNSLSVKGMSLNRFARFFMATTAGSAFCLTLMACYGAPPCEDGTDPDNDGYDAEGACTIEDCNDDDDTVFPGADEIAGDGVDSNCDGEDDPVDETGDAGVDDNDDAGMSSADGGM